MSNKVQLTVKALDAAKTVSNIMEMDEIRQKFVERYNAVSGTNEGEMKFAAESAMFMQLATANKKIEETTPFSKYASFMELCSSGLSLKDGISYMVPMGKQLVFMPGWRGRLEQIQEMQDVVFCHEPQVVYESDIFDYEKTESGIKINKHKPNGNFKREKGTPITDVYFIVQMSHGNIVYHMEALDVYNIRDKRSKSYQEYIKTLNNEKNQNAGKKYGDALIGLYKDNQTGGWKEFPIEPPMWVTDEAQAFKKTIVKRTYSASPNKLPKHKKLDSIVTDRVKATGADPETVDADEVVKPNAAGTPDIDPDFSTDLPTGDDDGYTEFEEINGDKVDKKTGEVQQPTNVDADDAEGDSF